MQYRARITSVSRGTNAGIQHARKYISMKRGVITMNSMFMESEFNSKVQTGAHQIQERRLAYSTTTTRWGDGRRTEYIWKFLMLLFKVCGKTKYALAAIRLHSQLNALLTLREAHSLRWNRTINLKGGIARNQAIDQVMEHNIKETKELMYAHGANSNFSSAQINSRASNPIKETICNFDHEIDLQKKSSKHKRRKDIFWGCYNFATSDHECFEGNSRENIPGNRNASQRPNFSSKF